MHSNEDYWVEELCDDVILRDKTVKTTFVMSNDRNCGEPALISYLEVPIFMSIKVGLLDEAVMSSMTINSASWDTTRGQNGEIEAANSLACF